MNIAKKILNGLQEPLFYLAPVVGSIKAWEDLGTRCNFHEEVVVLKTNYEPYLAPELKDKLNYLLAESRKDMNKLYLILIAKTVFSFLISYFSNTPVYFLSDILLPSTEIYSRRKETPEEKMLQLLENFNR